MMSWKKEVSFLVERCAGITISTQQAQQYQELLSMFYLHAGTLLSA